MNMIRRSENRQSVSATNFLCNSREKKIWTSEEDVTLRNLVERLGTGNWTLISQSLPERTGKQCRERWHNHLGAGIKKGDWTEEEDRIIITMQKAIGNQWAKITKMLPGRTDNAVKNRFHATERAKSRGGRFDDDLGDEYCPESDSAAASQPAPFGAPTHAQQPYPQQRQHLQQQQPYFQGGSVQSGSQMYGYRPDCGAYAGATPASTSFVHGGPHDDESDNMSEISDCFEAADPRGAPLPAGHQPHQFQQTQHPLPCQQQQQPFSSAVPALYEVQLHDKPSGYGDDGGGEESEADSLTELMELDIISFDEEDLAYSCGAEMRQAHMQQQQAMAEPGCMSFEWAASATKSLCGGARDSSGAAASLGNYYSGAQAAAPHVPAHMGIPQHRAQQQVQQQQQSRYMCGLEAWGCKPPQQQHPAAYGAYPQQQQFSRQGHPSQGYGSHQQLGQYPQQPPRSIGGGGHGLR